MSIVSTQQVQTPNSHVAAVNTANSHKQKTNYDCVHCNNLASFPGHSHLQYLIAYSMQIRRGKAWEISSRAVMSGRQKVDTRGTVPDSSNCRFVLNRPWRYE